MLIRRICLDIFQDKAAMKFFQKLLRNFKNIYSLNICQQMFLVRFLKAICSRCFVIKVFLKADEAMKMTVAG